MSAAATHVPTAVVLTPPPSLELVGVRPGFCGGKPHILGHRIKVQHIAIWHHRLAMSAEEIVVTYPTLTLAQVFAALSYYHLHRAEIDADIVADEKFVAELKSAGRPSLFDRVRAARDAANDPISS